MASRMNQLGDGLEGGDVQQRTLPNVGVRLTRIIASPQMSSDDDPDSPFFQLDKFNPDSYELPDNYKLPATVYHPKSKMPSSSRSSSSPSPAPPAPPSAAAAAAQQAPAFTNMLPHAGHHADLQLINSMVNELCEVHAGNRKAMDEMIAKYEELRLSYEEVANLPPGSVPGPLANGVSRSEHEALKAKLRQSQEQHKEILAQCDDLHLTNDKYEDTMAYMMEKVRVFADSHTTTLIAWHKYYNTIIQQLRDESLQKSLEHSRWQESLGRLNGYIRDAYRSYCEEANPLYYKIAYLKRENKVMRSLLEWPEQEMDSDDERDKIEDELEEARKELEKVTAREAARG